MRTSHNIAVYAYFSNQLSKLRAYKSFSFTTIISFTTSEATYALLESVEFHLTRNDHSIENHEWRVILRSFTRMNSFNRPFSYVLRKQALARYRLALYTPAWTRFLWSWLFTRPANLPCSVGLWYRRRKGDLGLRALLNSGRTRVSPDTPRLILGIIKNRDIPLLLPTNNFLLDFCKLVLNTTFDAEDRRHNRVISPRGASHLSVQGSLASRKSKACWISACIYRSVYAELMIRI